MYEVEKYVNPVSGFSYTWDYITADHGILVLPGVTVEVLRMPSSPIAISTVDACDDWMVRFSNDDGVCMSTFVQCGGAALSPHQLAKLLIDDYCRNGKDSVVYHEMAW